jgi:hypothetical protein
MPEPLPAAPVKSRRRWLRWLLTPLLLVGAVAGCYLYAGHMADRELAEVVAETDRADPDWRLEQISAKRATYRPEDNAAETVLEAYRMLPASWLSAAGSAGTLEDRALVPPQLAFEEALVRGMRAELARDGVRDALAATASLDRQTGGRYEIVAGKNPLGGDQPYQHTRVIIRLLRMRAWLYDQEGQADDALATARRILVAGRGVGDEPAMLAQLVRFGAQLVATQVIERVLAQGLPSAEALARTQRLLSEDAADPQLLYAFRGERAAQHRFAEAVDAGELMMDGNTPKDWQERTEHLYVSRLARHYHTTLLRTFNEAVAIARGEPEEQGERLYQLAVDLNRRGQEPDNVSDVLAGVLLRSLAELGASFRRNRAVLRNAVVGVALERYRLATGRWPNELRELVPAYLPAVPRDPFDGQELRYRKLDDGVLIYAIGLDGQDNNGAMNRTNPLARGTDMGFRLWDAAARRQPAAELLQPPDSDGMRFAPPGPQESTVPSPP